MGPYLADQLLIPMALAGGGSFVSTPLSSHSTTNIGVIEKLWEVRGQAGPGPRISADERPEAEKTFQKALEMYKKIAQEADEGS